MNNKFNFKQNSIYEYLAQDLVNINNIDQVILTCEQLIQSIPNQPLWLEAILGYLYLQKNNIKKGLDTYNKIIKQNPQQEKWLKSKMEIVFFHQGIEQLRQGNIEIAINKFSYIQEIQASTKQQVTPWLQENKKPWPYIKFNWIEKIEKLKSKQLKWPKISIVTPSFNQGNYIEETILSILNQNYPNLEYIIVDNQSSDQTPHILNKYQNYISKIIVEPDNGQANAINKGFSYTTGELMTWINSDDMLAPGALHIAAIKYLQEKYDLIAGICLIHEDNRITSIVKPKAKSEDFIPQKLAQIGKLWSNGYYFRQPELLFTRKIWQQIGGALNENLEYALDYELWIKMAQNNAKLTIIDYPMAFFRNHQEQKTANYQFNTSCVLEQIEVRNKLYNPQLNPLRKKIITKKLDKFTKTENKKILVIANQENIIQFNENKGYIDYCHEPRNVDNLDSYDAIILLVLLRNELKILEYLKKQNYNKLLIGWFWYNNCQYYDNAVIAEQLDICIPANQFLADILVNESSLVSDSLPIACLEKNISDYQALKVEQREGFYIELPPYINYQNKQLINLIKQAFPDSKIIADDESISESEKLQQRLSYPVALCLPMANEIPPTFLTALLYEQIPIISTDIWELNRLIPETWIFPVINPLNVDLAYIKQLYQETKLFFHKNKYLSRLKTRILTDNLLPKRIDQILTLCYHLSTRES